MVYSGRITPIEGRGDGRWRGGRDEGGGGIL